MHCCIEQLHQRGHESYTFSAPPYLRHVTTETRTYVGQTGTQAFDGWAGFRLGQAYQLDYVLSAGQVAIERPTGQSPLVLSVEDFNAWFKP